MSEHTRPPLWEVMHQGFWKCPKENWRLSSAYMIRALRDWLVPETPSPSEVEFWPDDDAEREWQYSQRLRALLTTEADRAERGDD